MNWLSTLFISMLTSNALLTWGFGLRAGFKTKRQHPPLWFGGLLALDLVASVMLWFFSSQILQPLGLSSLIAIVYVLFVIPTLRLLTRLAISVFGVLDSSRSIELDELTLSTLVFGVSLIAVRGSSSLAECLLAAVAAAFGWWAAVGVLAAINRRTEDGSLPSVLKGGPSILLSAALLAMTISFANSALAQGFGK